MSVKNLLFVLTCHQGYVRHVEDEKNYVAENNLLFSSISSTYLPLIRMFRSLAADGIAAKVSLVISPIVCSLLTDAAIQEQYIAWLDERIALGEREVARCSGAEAAAAKACLMQFMQDKQDFVETYDRNLLREFLRFSKKGLIEFLATAGSYAFLPHYADMPEILNAQVETGLCSHRSFFGARPDGFWLPYMGYAPGIENVLRAYGFNYTFVDTHALLFGKTQAADGIFSPVRCQNSFVLFARDTTTPDDLIGKNGLSQSPCYRDVNKDIGYELTNGELGEFVPVSGARISTGYRYRAKSGDIYNAEYAKQQATEAGKRFIAAKCEKLTKASEALGGKDVSLTCALPLDELCAAWDESITFLEAAIRSAASAESSYAADGFSLCAPSSLLKNQFSLQKLNAYPSAATGLGYGEDLLDNTNGWMVRYTRKMCERMVDLAGRFPTETGLKARLLNLAAKELMIAQGSEWAKMLHEGQLPEYVREHFKASIRAFITVFDSLGSNTVSTEWLTRLEREHPIFPWMNYLIFARKK